MRGTVKLYLISTVEVKKKINEVHKGQESTYPQLVLQISCDQEHQKCILIAVLGVRDEKGAMERPKVRVGSSVAIYVGLRGGSKWD